MTAQGHRGETRGANLPARPASVASPAAGGVRETAIGYLTPDHPRLDRVQNAISGACAVVAAASLVAMAGLTVGEVFTRTFFDTPIGWNVAFVEQYLMMAMAFFGMVTAYRTGAHVAVQSLYDRLPGPYRKIVALLIRAVVLAGCLWLVRAGASAAWYSFATAEAPVPGSAELTLPTWWWKSIMPVGTLLGAVVVAIDLYRELVGSWRSPCTDYASSDADPEAGADEEPVAGAGPGTGRETGDRR